MIELRHGIATHFPMNLSLESLLPIPGRPIAGHKVIEYIYEWL